MYYSPQQRSTLWLYSFVCPAIDRFARIVAELGSPEEIFEEPPARLEKYLGAEKLGQMRRQNTDAAIDRLIEGMEARGITFVCRGDPEYPEEMDELEDFIVPPEVLFVRGARDLNVDHSIAVVGTRGCTPDGYRIAHDFARDFARAGAAVVSGLAVGIDAAALEGALESGGRTIGILGCGVDVPYPGQNQRLVARMLEAGGSVISEFMPGTPPLRPNFPIRNRIIAGMSDGTLIVQAPTRSGALNTATYALECGKDVFVVPGSILDPKFAGSNALLRDGAAPVLCSRDVLETLRFDTIQPDEPVGGKKPCALTDDELIISNMLRKREQSFDEMIAQSGFGTAKLNSLLTMLKIKGIIYETAGKHYRIQDA